jgi:hypothetical protein
MTNFARIINNTAVDVSTDPTNQFHPDIAAQFEPVPDEVQAGWVRNEEGEWEAPTPTPEPEPTPSEAPKVSPVEFKLLFTSQERVAIKAARATDPVIDDFYDIVEDPRLTFVDLGLQSTQDALTYMVAQGLLTEDRRSEILSGKVQ